MNRTQAIAAIEAIGYDVRLSGEGDALFVAVGDEGGDSPAAANALTELRAALPGLDVDWTGDGNTDADGCTTSDISISGWEELEEQYVLRLLHEAALNPEECIQMPPCSWCDAECYIMTSTVRACEKHLDELGEVDPSAAAKARLAIQRARMKLI